MNCTVTITRVADGVSATYSIDAATVSVWGASVWGACDCMARDLFDQARGDIVDDSPCPCTVGEFTAHVVREDGVVIYSDAKGAA